MSKLPILKSSHSGKQQISAADPDSPDWKPSPHCRPGHLEAPESVLALYSHAAGKQRGGHK